MSNQISAKNICIYMLRLYISLLLAYDNTGALYVIGFLYEFRRFKDKQLACSMRVAHREKKKERKEGRNEDKGRARHIG